MGSEHIWPPAHDGGGHRTLRNGDACHDSATGDSLDGETLVTTDHILVETWTLLRFRIHRGAAEAFWDGLRSGVARLECVGSADLQAAWTTGRDFSDQDFSLVDRTSFAVMERLGLRRAASFDADFLGPTRHR